MKQLITVVIISSPHSLRSTIAEKFKKSLSQHGVLYVKEKSEEEAAIVQFCEQHSLTYRKQFILGYSKHDSLESSHYYLSVHDTREYNYDMFQLVCDGGGNKAICFYGAKQVRKLTSNHRIENVISKYDIAVNN